jgi:hypothetical protein
VNGLCCDSSLKFTTEFLKPAKDFQNKASRHCQILFSQNSGKFLKFPGEIHLERGMFPSVAPITTRQRNLANTWKSQIAALAAVPTSVRIPVYLTICAGNW